MTVRSELIADLKVAIPEVAGRVYGEVAPDGAVLPHISVHVELSVTGALKGDAHNRAYQTINQVDLWQWVVEEDQTLVRKVRDFLDGWKGTALAGVVNVGLDSYTRLQDPEPGLVHHAFSLSVVTN